MTRWPASTTRRDRCWRPLPRAICCAHNWLRFADYCDGYRSIQSGHGSRSPSSWSSPTGTRCKSDNVQTLRNPETEDCEEENAPSDSNYFQVPAEDCYFATDRVLSSRQVRLGAI